MTYSIIRYYRDSDTPNETIEEGLTLAEARAHCSDPNTSTDEWFDGYISEEEHEVEGWTNRSTWLVNLWLMNEESSYRTVIAGVEAGFLDSDKSTQKFILENISLNMLERIRDDGCDFDKVNWNELREGWNDG